MNIELFNPATEKKIGELAADDKDSIAKKYAAARAAQPAWHRLGVPARLGIIKKFRDRIEKDLEEAALTLTRDVGKPIAQSRNELNGLLVRLDFFLAETEKTLATEIVYPVDRNVEAQNSASLPLIEEIEHEPLGVIANISAWNYPWFVGSNVYVPALLAGNAVLYKPSELALNSGLLMARYLHESGVPAEIFSVICGKGDVGAALVEQPIDGVFFTGSVATGHKIAESAAKKFIKVQLELGGKDPAYITDDVDAKAAAEATADGAMYNTGQSCCSVERIYVHEKIYNDFVLHFKATVAAFKIGNPEANDTYIGALTRGKAAFDFLQGQIADAVKHGGRIVHGGGRAQTETGYFLEPTVIENANHSMALMREESFGPVIGIMKVKDDAEAQKLMNDTAYGLTAAVYCRDTARAKNILHGVNAGSAYINCCDRVSPRLPWSGRGASGVGLTLSTYGIETFTRPKAWHIK
ncbi:MAG: aldehyde dehydrogenase family protein [Spirochaetes bacterium]|nr:aldehyde dehydrogenase family protein [Spirochaetota bacterium]